MDVGKKAVISIITLSILGCGGGGSGEQNITPSARVAGKVIDGYVSGATVFLDVNNNGMKDVGEPFSVSGDAGEYILELDGDAQGCLNYVPIIVDVPVGAVDAEFGVVTEAYQMSLPPTSAFEESESAHITPLTTMAWDAAKNELDLSYGTSTCAQLKQNHDITRLLNEGLERAVNELEREYDLSEGEIYADFINTGNAKAHGLAVKMVDGFKYGYAQRSELIKQGKRVWWHSYRYFEEGHEIPGYVKDPDDNSPVVPMWRLMYAHVTEQGAETIYESGTSYYLDLDESAYIATPHRTYRRGIVDVDGWARTTGYEVSVINDTDALGNSDTIYYCAYRDDTFDEKGLFTYARITTPVRHTDDVCDTLTIEDFTEVRETISSGTRETELFYGTWGTPTSLINCDMADINCLQNELSEIPHRWDDSDNFIPMPSWWLKAKTENGITYERGTDGDKQYESN